MTDVSKLAGLHGVLPRSLTWQSPPLRPACDCLEAWKVGAEHDQPTPEPGKALFLEAKSECFDGD